VGRSNHSNFFRLPFLTAIFVINAIISAIGKIIYAGNSVNVAVGDVLEEGESVDYEKVNHEMVRILYFFLFLHTKFLLAARFFLGRPWVE
jgi:hypothetical protein